MPWNDVLQWMWMKFRTTIQWWDSILRIVKFFRKIYSELFLTFNERMVKNSKKIRNIWGFGKNPIPKQSLPLNNESGWHFWCKWSCAVKLRIYRTASRVDNLNRFIDPQKLFFLWFKFKPYSLNYSPNNSRKVIKIYLLHEPGNFYSRLQIPSLIKSSFYVACPKMDSSSQGEFCTKH